MRTTRIPQFLQTNRNTKSDERDKNEKFERNSKKGDERSLTLKHKKKKWMIPSREGGWKKRPAFSSPTNALDRKTRRSTTTSSRISKKR